MSDSSGTTSPQGKKPAIKRAGQDPKTTQAKAPVSTTTATPRPQQRSKLVLPGSHGFRNPHTGAPVADPTEDFEPYPSEINEIKTVLAAIQEKYGFRAFTDSSCTQFENETRQRMLEIGIESAVLWKDVDVDDDPNSDTLYFVPTVTITGRTARQAIDHDRMKHEIQSGELDGQQFVIKEDGSKAEAPSRKQL